MKPTLKVILIVSVIATILIIGTVAAATILYVPGDNSLEGTPLDPVASTSPTPTATPTPTPEIEYVSAHLTANDTADGTYIFYKGDTLAITATTNKTGVYEINLYNKGVLLDTQNTNADGIVTFIRSPVNNPYVYTVTVKNELPD